MRKRVFDRVTAALFTWVDLRATLAVVTWSGCMSITLELALSWTGLGGEVLFTLVLVERTFVRKGRLRFISLTIRNQCKRRAFKNRYVSFL